MMQAAAEQTLLCPRFPVLSFLCPRVLCRFRHFKMNPTPLSLLMWKPHDITGAMTTASPASLTFTSALWAVSEYTNYKLQQNNCDLSAFIGLEAHINFIFRNFVLTNLQTPLSLAKWKWNLHLGFWSKSKMSNTGLNLTVLCPISLFPINRSAAYSVNIMLP